MQLLCPLLHLQPIQLPSPLHNCILHMQSKQSTGCASQVGADDNGYAARLKLKHLLGYLQDPVHMRDDSFMQEEEAKGACFAGLRRRWWLCSQAEAEAFCGLPARPSPVAR